MKRTDDLPNVALVTNPRSDSPPPPTRTKRQKAPSSTDESRPAIRFVAAPAPAFELSSTELPSREQIRERAYFIYLARNGAAGDAQADWLRAEQELISERARASSRRTAR
jgi:hypothetical protein